MARRSVLWDARVRCAACGELRKAVGTMICQQCGDDVCTACTRREDAHTSCPENKDRVAARTEETIDYFHCTAYSYSMPIVLRYEQVGADESEVGAQLERFLERWRSASSIRFEPVRVEHKLKKGLLGFMRGWSEISATVSHGNPSILSSIAHGVQGLVKPSLRLVHPSDLEQGELTLASANEGLGFPAPLYQLRT